MVKQLQVTVGSHQLSKTKMNTPILYIAFKRPDYVKQTLPAVLEQDPKYLTIVIDGASDESEQAMVDEVADYVESLKTRATITRRAKNLGCERNVIQSINDCFEKYGDLIVVEDDVKISKEFVGFIEQNKQAVVDEQFGFIGRSEDQFKWFSWGWYITRESWKKNFYIKNIYHSWEEYEPYFQMSDDIRPIIKEQFQAQTRFTWDAQLRINVSNVAKKEILFYDQSFTENIGHVSSNQLRFQYVGIDKVIDTLDGSYLYID